MVTLIILFVFICLFIGLVVGAIASMLITYAAMMDKLDDEW